MENIFLRRAEPQDKTLLFTIYYSTRTEEINRAIDWNEDQKLAFINHQFFAQDEYYKKVYPDAAYDIIMYNNVPVGRLYVERFLIPGTIRIIDIALLPEFRNLGIGSHLIKQLKNEAFQHGKSLTIHVEVFNKAFELYKRLDFQVIKETNGVYYLMEWNQNKE